MDTTKEFILQCEKAEEIQGEFKKASIADFGIQHEGDWLINCDGTPVVVSLGDSYYKKPIIWLPTQSQLQEMLGGFKKLFPRGMESIEINHKLCNSFEQLWLAFVMKEKYNKVWNGEEWKQ